MSFINLHLSRAVANFLRAGVALVLVALLLVTVAQYSARVGPWWLELSRYLPFPVFVVPAAVATWLAWSLGRPWFVAAVLTLVIVLTVTMGFEWHGPDSGGPSIRMMTYNIKTYRAREAPEGFVRLAREVALQHPDILVMEDADGLMQEPSAASSSNGPVFGLPNVYATAQFVVASRFALSGCTTPPVIPGEGPRYVHCTVKVDGVPLSVVAVHFESPRRGLNAARQEGLEGIDEWEQNYLDRLGQSRGLAEFLRQQRGPLIVAGDLNAPQSSPVEQTLLDTGLRDAFSAAGHGYGYTHGHALRVGFSFLRIDHVLVSPQLGVTDCFAGGREASEHRPVVADLTLQRLGVASGTRAALQ